MPSTRKFVARNCALFVIVIAAIASVGCGYNPPAAPQLSPSTVTLQSSASQSFTTTPVPGNVVWSVNGIPGGNDEVGVITLDGIYTAPAVAPAAPVTISVASSTFPTLANSATVAITNPAPKVAVISPDVLTVGTTATQLAVHGTGFTPASQILLGGSALSTQFTSASELWATIPTTALFTAELASVTVSNPPPGGGVSQSATLTVANPAPHIASASPNQAIASSVPAVIALVGDGYVPDTHVQANGVPVPVHYVSSSEVDVSLSSDVLTSASVDLDVKNAAPGGGTRSTSIPVAVAGTVTRTQHPLVAKYTVDLPAGASVAVDFGPNTSYGRSTWTVSAPPSGGPVDVLVAGMRASTAYHMRAKVVLPNDTTLTDQDHLFITGPLPSISLPITQVTKTVAIASSGVELVSGLNYDAGAAVLDADGQVIWYYYDPLFGSWAFPLEQLENGDLLINSRSEIREVNLAGEVVRTLSVSDVESKLPLTDSSEFYSDAHHDVLVLPNRHWVLLLLDSRNLQDLPGYPGTTLVTGDALVDVDENGNPVWVWRAFDHFDVNRHPIWFPDWTHSNAIVYTPDGNLLLSMRHQSWIVKIDYENGVGNGAILWRLGFEGDFQLANSDAAGWFYNQHDPVLLPSSQATTLALFDNGDARPDSSGQMCYLSNTCYSRAVIFNVDEGARTATVIWEYRPGWYSFWGGSVAVLPNGDFELESSAPDGNPSNILEVTPGSQPQEVWRLDFNLGGVYRAYRIPSLYPGVRW